jgi:hypothetical protein
VEKCYEYFGCNMEDCKMFKLDDDRFCWEVEGTLCSSHGIEVLQSHSKIKLDTCMHCLYYKNANRVDLQ